LEGSALTAIETGIVGALAIGVVVAWYYALIVLKHEPRVPVDQQADGGESFPVEEWEEITAHQLGQIEGNIKRLVRVVVAAHGVEEPTNALRQAVKKNLEQKVEYLFLVSQSRKAFEIDGWVHMFLSIAHVVLKRAGSQLEATDLIRISNLSYDWRDTPYVFYQSETADGQLSNIAFRGNQTDEGIAEKYVRLPAWLAYSMALALLSDAPIPMMVVEQPFTVVPEIDAAVLKQSTQHGEST
jgi:hypothetical protein